MEPPLERNAVTVTVPANAGFVHVLRAVTAAVASRLQVPYDGIEDLRLAVDEASARLLMLPAAASSLTLRLEPYADRLEIVVGVDATVGEWPPAGLEESLAWTILVALVDTVRPEMDRDGPSIRMVMRTADLASER
ncbi:MAG TPA: anti-sigma regulatory factor [Actinomycetota bacterium]|nr:anti-sigma regulatory factor [Actinomycetota bacterium]